MVDRVVYGIFKNVYSVLEVYIFIFIGIRGLGLVFEGGWRVLERLLV